MAQANAAKSILNLWPKEVPAPFIVTEESGIIYMDWNLPGDPTLDVKTIENTAYFHMFKPDMSDLEDDFELNTRKDYEAMIYCITKALKDYSIKTENTDADGKV